MCTQTQLAQSAEANEPAAAKQSKLHSSLQASHAAHLPIPVLQVPDTLLLESSVTPKAATVSSLLLSWILSNEQLGMKLYQVIRNTDSPRLLLALLLASHLFQRLYNNVTPFFVP